MILKQVIRYENAPAIEATWVLRTQLPDVDVPASPALYDGDGKEFVPAVEAYTRPGEVVETVVRCHAYSNHPEQIAQLRADLGADAEQYESLIAEVAATYTPPPPDQEPSQFDLDRACYTKRAAVKDALIAWMAADNMSRVRAGTWSVAQLTSLMADPAVAATNAYMSTLSFELAAQSIAAATSPLLTPEIKAAWIARLQEHFYLEG